MLMTAPVISVFAGGSPPVIPDDVKEHVRQRIDNGGTGGIVVGVVDANGATFFSYGDSKAGGAKVSEDSVFEIGSISKAFTGLLLADAVLEGKVALDDPASKYLPANVKMPTRGEKVITLGLLSSHRSGLPRMPDNFEPKDQDNPFADYTVERLYAFLNGVKLERDPGAGYEYSNVGAGLLGHVLTTKAGKSYDDLLLERITKPVGLTETACQLTPNMKKNLAQGHAAGEPTSNWDLNESLIGAGGIRSTARDMTKFLAACMGFGNDRMPKLVAKCVEKTYPTTIPETEVGLGWHIDKKYGTTAVWHNGGTGGYHSFCGFLPDKKFGIVVLANAEDDIDDIGLHLLKPQSELQKLRPVAKIDTGKLNDYLGWFELKPGVNIHITKHGNSLKAQLTGQEAYPVFAEGTDKFFFKVVDAQLTFGRDDGGKVNKVTLHQNGRDQAANKLPPDKEPKEKKEVKVDAKILKEYVGRFAMVAAPTVIFDVKVEGEQLTVQLTGQPRFPVFAESETKFFYKVVEAQITFEKDDKGKVSSLILHQGGMDQKANRVE